MLERIGSLCDYILFDEAWMAYARFHPLFADRYGMALRDLKPGDPGIYTTQSPTEDQSPRGPSALVGVTRGG